MSGPQLFNILPRKLPGPPKWPYRVNWGSPQANHLEAMYVGTPSGSEFFDLVRGRHAVHANYNDTVQDDFGQLGYAYNASMSSDAGDFLDVILGTTYTIRAICRPNSVSTNTIVTSYRSTIASAPIFWQLDHNNADVRIIVRQDTGGTVSAAATSGIPAAGTLMEFIGTRSGDNLEVFARNWKTGAVVSGTGSGTIGTITANKLLIGGFVNASETIAGQFNGDIYLVQVWSYVLPEGIRNSLWTHGSRHDLYWEKSQRTYIFPAHFPAVTAVAVGPPKHEGLMVNIGRFLK